MRADAALAAPVVLAVVAVAIFILRWVWTKDVEQPFAYTFSLSPFDCELSLADIDAETAAPVKTTIVDGKPVSARSEGDVRGISSDREFALRMRWLADDLRATLSQRLPRLHHLGAP